MLNMLRCTYHVSSEIVEIIYILELHATSSDVLNDLTDKLATPFWTA
jgi:hypothetical protein